MYLHYWPLNIVIHGICDLSFVKNVQMDIVCILISFTISVNYTF